MLFNKKIDPRCVYCMNSKQINDDEAICKKNGIVSLSYKCRKFKYDPTKRVPPEPELLEKDAFSEADFLLK